MLEFNCCSFCGGFTDRTEDTELNIDGYEKEKVVEFMKLELPKDKRHPQKPDQLIVCVKCFYKLFHQILGQAMYHGVELLHLKDVMMRKGYRPSRAPISL